MNQMYYDNDADLSHLKGKKVAVIGYGSQGHSQALNLKESGIDVVVGLQPGGRSWRVAESHGWKPLPVNQAAKAADVIMILIPDERHHAVYEAEIKPHLTAGKTLMVSHGFSVHYNQIVPPKDVDVSMIAPKSPGHLLRRMYEEGRGVPALLAIYQDATGQAKERALAYARAIGSTRAGVIETTFREETESDLFGEQAVLCGGVSELIKAGWETLVEAGYAPEIAYFECLHELKLIVDLVYEGGLSLMRYSVSDTAQYGDMTRGSQVVGSEARQAMKKLLKDIQEGVFAREWILENQANRPVFNALANREAAHPIEEVGQRLRAMMPWLKEKKLLQ